MYINDYDKLCREFCEKAIDKELLTDIDKLTRYNGDEIYDEKITITNIGTVRKKEFMAKIDIVTDKEGKFSINIDNEVKEPHFYYFDLTLLSDTSVCSDFNKFLLVSERVKFQTEIKEPRKLWVYCVTNGKGNKEIPSINNVKKAIRSGDYTPYQSLLYEFCGVYSLSKPTDKCDKMATLFTLIADIEMAKYDHPELFSIDIEERLENNHKAKKKRNDQLTNINI